MFDHMCQKTFSLLCAAVKTQLHGNIVRSCSGQGLVRDCSKEDGHRLQLTSYSQNCARHWQKNALLIWLLLLHFCVLVQIRAPTLITTMIALMMMMILGYLVTSVTMVPCALWICS